MLQIFPIIKFRAPEPTEKTYIQRRYVLELFRGFVALRVEYMLPCHRPGISLKLILIVAVAKAEKWFDLMFDIPAMNGVGLQCAQCVVVGKRRWLIKSGISGQNFRANISRN